MRRPVSGGGTWKRVQYYEAVSKEVGCLTGHIWRKYWTERLHNISRNHSLTVDRVAAFEPGGRRFESVLARQINDLRADFGRNVVQYNHWSSIDWLIV